MLLGFLLIWCLLFFVLKYDLKQNNINSIVRATCFTLITYIILDIKVKEYFKGKKKKHADARDKHASGTDASATDASTTDASGTDASATDASATDASGTGAIEMPDTTTVDDNSITKNANSYKKTKNKCNYIKEQQRLTANSLHQNAKEILNAASINDTQIELVQNNFNDLIAVKQIGDNCDS
jgi:hypothetical protein